MATFVKDVLYPGTYSVADGKGGNRKVRYTRSDVAFLANRMEAMLAAGLQIPLSAAHQKKAKPLTEEERRADWVRNLVMGWATSGEVSPEGFLCAKVDVPVKGDAERLPAVRFVSPEIINDFVDGTGRKWPGPSITHLAVTPRPVQHNQQPFQPVQMSTDCIRLSLTDYEGEQMAEEKKGDESSAQKKADERAGAKQFDLDKLRCLLAEDGYGVPDHISDHSEFLEHLNTAALSKKAMVDKLLSDDEDDEDEEEDPVDPEPVAVPANAPVMMSLAGHQFALQPVKKKGKKAAKPATQLGLTDERTQKLEKALLSERRQSIAGRIERLFETGRITKPIRDKLATEAGTVRLSLDDAGQVASNAVLSKVEAYEDLLPGSAWPTSGALPPGVSVAEPSSGWHGDDSPKEVKQRVDDFFSTLAHK